MKILTKIMLNEWSHTQEYVLYYFIYTVIKQVELLIWVVVIQVFHTLLEFIIHMLIICAYFNKD